MIAKLLYLNANGKSEVIPLESLPLTLGRGADADVRILDQCASRRHCRIFQVENQLVVQDLGSTLGTLVNGQPIEEARLNPGDSLTVGISTFRVDLEIRTKTSLLSRIEASIKSLGQHRGNASRKLPVRELIRDRPEAIREPQGASRGSRKRTRG